MTLKYKKHNSKRIHIKKKLGINQFKNSFKKRERD
jgi:hypothetical protein